MPHTTRVYYGVHTNELQELADRCRQEDRDEAEAWGTTWANAAEMIVSAQSRIESRAWIVYMDDSPVFAFGLVPAQSGVYTLWGFGTSDTPKIVRPLVRWGRKHWIHDMFGPTSDIRRIEVRVPIRSTHSWPWLQRIGCEIEGRLRAFGVHGEDFLLLSYTRNDYEQQFKGETNVSFLGTSGSSPAAAHTHENVGPSAAGV